MSEYPNLCKSVIACSVQDSQQLFYALNMNIQGTLAEGRRKRVEILHAIGELLTASIVVDWRENHEYLS